MTRFFQTTIPVYEAVRNSLDTLWEHPKTVGIAHTESCLPAVSEAVTDDEGNVYVPLHETFFQWETVQSSIVNLINEGQIIEILEQEYRAHLPVTYMV